MTRLHVVVAEGLGVVVHIVDDLGGNVLEVGLDEVVVVACRLSLKYVAVVKQNDIPA